jgi:cardiolipin synthase
VKLLPRKAAAAFNPHNKVRFVHGGPPFFETLASLLRGARHVVHFQTYIFREDRAGRMIRDELLAAAGRGVAVFLLCDGYATTFTADWRQRFEQAGIRFRYFEPLFSGRRFYFGRRLHHKVTVADERAALVGGINVSDHYLGRDHEPPWLDFAVHVEGQAAAELHAVCEKLWHKDGVRPTLPNLKRKIVYTPGVNPDPVLVRVRVNDWVRAQTGIVRSYAELLHQARHDVLIVCSYFFPNRLFRHRLRKAARRGVRIRVVLAGVSDVKISRPAARYLYGWMLQHGIEIFEYGRTVLHAKLATCDGQWMTVGSFNINNLSSHASIEVNLDIREADFVGDVNADLEKIIRNDCRPITIEEYRRHRSVFTRAVEWGAYQVSRFLLFLLAYNLKQEKDA